MEMEGQCLLITKEEKKSASEDKFKNKDKKEH